jgi:hypothetical protein
MGMSDTSKIDYSEPADAPEGPGFWVKELPYLAILVLTIGGVGYISLTRQPLIGYWEFMAVALFAICVAAGWPHAADPQARWRLVSRQALHWGAFLVAMNIFLLPTVRAITNDDTVSLAILLLLALGTFTSGVHIGSWRMSLNGLIMALGVPAIAWLDQSALFISIVVVLVVAVASAFFWWRHQLTKDAADT